MFRGRARSVSHGYSRYSGGSAPPTTYYDGITWGAIADTKFGSTQIIAVAQIGSRVYFVGDTGKVSYTTDGSTFTLQDIGAGVTALYCCAGNGLVGLVMGISGHGYRTADGGVSWAEVTTNFSATTIRTVVHCGGNTWWAGGNSGKNIISTDNGVTWSAQSVLPGGPTIDAAAWDGTTLIVAGGTDIYYSTDLVNWSTYDAPVAAYGVAAIATAAWYGDRNGDVFKSANHGAAWSACGETGFGSSDILDVAYNSLNGVLFVVGQAGGANRSADNGATFGGALIDLGFGLEIINCVAFTALGVFAGGAGGIGAVSTSKS